MDEYCREKGFVDWYETSAKENVNIDDAAKSLVTKVDYLDSYLRANSWGNIFLDIRKWRVERVGTGQRSRSVGCETDDPENRRRMLLLIFFQRSHYLFFLCTRVVTFANANNKMGFFSKRRLGALIYT